MTATGPRHKEIWSPVIENEESDEKNETIDLSTSKTLINAIEHPLPFSPFQLPPVFPFGPFGLTRMPLIMPPLNQAFLAMCTKSFQQQLSKPHQSETKKALKLACPTPKKDATAATQNPIVNEILKDSLPEQQHSINHNVCAVCGEGFRLTGDLVHHMRREKCRWTPKSSASSDAAPYQIPKRENK
uniref:C2H2-type domain-containing protein n=1 Tax=Panagrolaimus sp. ES5 TaxID=591445 RepID=A0AC34FCE2_9BILA